MNARKELFKIRNYFGKHDKTGFEHWAYKFLDGFIEAMDQEDASQPPQQSLTEPLKEKPFINRRTADNGEHSHWELLNDKDEIIWTEDTENCFMDKHHPSQSHSPKQVSEGESEKALSDLADKFKLDRTKISKLAFGWRLCYEWFSQLAAKPSDGEESNCSKNSTSWISVEDEHPECDGEDHGFIYCMISQSSGRVRQARYNTRTENFLDHSFNTIDKITHWQPLPKPPSVVNT